MREATVKEIMQAMRSSYETIKENLGVTDSPEKMLEKGIEFTYKFMPQQSQLGAKISKAAKTKGSMAAIESYLATLPEPTPEEKVKYISVMKELPFLMRSAFIDVQKRMPHKRRGTHPRFDGNPHTERLACLDYGRLIGCGVESQIAFDRTANKYNVSTRTMRRAWNDYARLQGAKK